MKFPWNIFRTILALIKRLFPEESAQVLLRTSYAVEERVPDYIIKAFDGHSGKYLSPYQVSLYHPLIKNMYKEALRETLEELEKLVTAGWLKVSDIVCPMTKVIIPARIFTILQQEFKVAEKEKKERLGLLHGYIETENTYVQDLTDATVLEEKGFFTSRDFLSMKFSLEAHQMIAKNLEKWLSLSKEEVIGTYHTHLIPYHSSPSLKDMALLMTNPCMPHLILCGRGSFAYTFKSYRRILWMDFPKKTSLEIILA